MMGEEQKKKREKSQEGGRVVGGRLILVVAVLFCLGLATRLCCQGEARRGWVAMRVEKGAEED